MALIFNFNGSERLHCKLTIQLFLIFRHTLFIAVALVLAAFKPNLCLPFQIIPFRKVRWSDGRKHLSEDYGALHLDIYSFSLHVQNFQGNRHCK